MLRGMARPVKPPGVDHARIIRLRYGENAPTGVGVYPPTKPLLTVPEIAAVMKIHPRTVFKALCDDWNKTRQLPPRQRGRP